MEKQEATRLRWSNVPIPEAHVAGLVLGAVLQSVFRRRLLPSGWLGRLLGWPLILLGAGLAWWAVRQAGEADIETPRRLLTGGPYALSRNPMYVGWTLIYLGVALASNSALKIALLPPVVAYTHLVEILREEASLEQQFGDEYRAYRRHVPRYL